MLVLSRRINEKIVLPSIQATIEVVAIKPGTVRLGISAPPEVTVLREEVPDRAREWGPSPAPAADPGAEAKLRQLTQLMRNRLTIAGKGLTQARQHLLAGCPQDVEVILEHLDEDLRLLQQRLEDKVEKAPPRQSKAHRALLVEDDRNERELLASLLRLSGVEVDTAGDGIDALNYLKDHDRPDVVLLDMGLPRCDGATTVRNIRQDPAFAGLKIFAVTGHAPEQFHLDQGPRGIDRWFRKPINSDALLRDLTRELDVVTNRP